MKKAEETAQPHVIKWRPQFRKLLPDLNMGPDPDQLKVAKSGAIDFSDLPVFGVTWPEQKARTGPKYGWQFGKVRGLVGTVFDRHINWGHVRAAIKKADPKSTIRAKRPNTESFLGSVVLLTNTTKMGAFSWNMPAGPEAHGGTCPGAQLAFYLDAEGEDKATSIAHAIERFRSHAAEQLRAEVPDARDAVRRFICNGCYAMKGAYGNPSVVMIMEWRRKWLMDWALARSAPSSVRRKLPTAPNLFVPVMMGIINQSLSVSKKRIDRAGDDPIALASTTHPKYFRIHDAGDMVNGDYLDSWLEICKRMPHIHFWAPTRVWAHGQLATVLEDRIRRGMIPPNLALRPSGLFFDGPPPEIPGLSGGASSNTVSFHTRQRRMKVSITGATPKAWLCPAYLPTVVGGEALPSVRTIGQAAKPLSPANQMKLISYIGKFVKLPKSKAKTLSEKAREARFKVAEKAVKTEPQHKIQILSRADDLLAQQTSGRVSNPKEQSFAMYPNVDNATPARKEDVFYDAVYDPVRKQFIINPKTGRPMVANEKTLKANPGTIAAKTQKFQAAGACVTARDPNHAAACRVCWNTTNDRRTEGMRVLPVIYGKH